MKINPGELRLYAVTDRAWAGGMDGVIRQVEAAVKGGATFVQIREKGLDAREFLSEARWIVELCHRMGVRCVINDNVDVALLSGADGVHVGQDDRPAKRRAPCWAGGGLSASPPTMWRRPWPPRPPARTTSAPARPSRRTPRTSTATS